MNKTFQQELTKMAFYMSSVILQKIFKFSKVGFPTFVVCTN